jgi:hypothetical protein
MIPLRLTPRLAVAATFAAFGLNAGAWAGASAAVVARVGVSATGFGLALTVMTVVYLAAMSSAAAIAARIGIRRTLLSSLLAMGPMLALLVSARNGLWLGIALALFGALVGLLDSAMNAEGSRVEQRSGKPIFVQFHAVASATTAAFALFGSYLAFRGLGWLIALVVEVGLLVVAVIVAKAIDEPQGEPRIGGIGAAPRVIDAGLAMLGLAIGVSIVCESSALAWSALLLRHDAPTLAAYAGAGAGLFAAFQAAMRFGIDRIRRAVSDRALMLVSYAVAALGLGLVAADLGFAASVLGFAILGVGTGAIVPCGFALAARRPGLSAGAAISAVSFFGLFPRAPAPLLTGFVADALSLSAAFFGLAVLMLIAMAGVGFLVPSPQRTSSRETLAPGGLAK